MNGAAGVLRNVVIRPGRPQRTRGSPQVGGAPGDEPDRSDRTTCSSRAVPGAVTASIEFEDAVVGAEVEPGGDHHAFSRHVRGTR
jgi:hypothetical protein